MLQTPLGLSALVYGLAALAVGTVSTGTIKSTRWIPVVATMAASAAAVTLYALLAAVFGLERAFGLRLVPMIFVVAGVNGLLALPCAGRHALGAGGRRPEALRAPRGGPAARRRREKGTMSGWPLNPVDRA